MAATNGTAVFVGASGKTYAIDVYVPDAIATKWTWNASGLAASTSTDYWQAPEPVVLVDISMAAAPTAVGGTFTVDGVLYPGQNLRWANQQNSITFRPKLNIPFKTGQRIGVLQF